MATVIMKKENKILRVDETSIDSYLSQGFDYVEFDEIKKKYIVIKPASGKVIPYEEHLKVVNEVEKLKAEIAKLKAPKK